MSQFLVRIVLMSRHNERVCVNYVPLWVNKVSHSRQKRPLSHASHCGETDFFVVVKTTDSFKNTKIHIEF